MPDLADNTGNAQDTQQLAEVLGARSHTMKVNGGASETLEVGGVTTLAVVIAETLAKLAPLSAQASEEVGAVLRALMLRLGQVADSPEGAALVGPVKITLRPLSLAAMVELSQTDFETAAAELLRTLYLSAKRGGYEGNPGEFGELLEGDEVLAAREELEKLAPLSARAGRLMLGLPDPAAEAGTAPSGG